jgi:hypothetical protein
MLKLALGVFCIAEGPSRFGLSSEALLVIYSNAKPFEGASVLHELSSSRLCALA